MFSRKDLEESVVWMDTVEFQEEDWEAESVEKLITGLCQLTKNAIKHKLESGDRTSSDPFLPCSRSNRSDEVSFVELFGRSYDKLSDLCISKLQKQLKKNLSLPANTLIVHSDNQAFAFGKRGVEFLFDPGFLAEESLGSQTALIEYSLLSKLMQSRSPTAALIVRSVRHNKTGNVIAWHSSTRAYVVSDPGCLDGD